MAREGGRQDWARRKAVGGSGKYIGRGRGSWRVGGLRISKLISQKIGVFVLRASA